MGGLSTWDNFHQWQRHVAQRAHSSKSMTELELHEERVRQSAELVKKQGPAAWDTVVVLVHAAVVQQLLVDEGFSPYCGFQFVESEGWIRCGRCRKKVKR